MSEKIVQTAGITDSSLKYHLQNAKNNGVTKDEIAAKEVWDNLKYKKTKFGRKNGFVIFFIGGEWKFLRKLHLHIDKSKKCDIIFL